MKKKYFILFLFFHFILLFFLRKHGILILDLYLYSIKIQTNIDQNAVKYLRKSTNFLKEILF